MKLPVPHLRLKTNHIQNVTHDVSQPNAVMQKSTNHQILDFFGSVWQAMVQ
jgi:hypothetical protein